MKPTKPEPPPSRLDRAPEAPSLRDLFTELEPPPNGLPLLRRRLEAPRRQRRRWTLVAAAPALAAVLLWLWLRPIAELPAAGAGHRSLPHPAMVGLGIEPAPSEPVSVPASASHQVAVRRVTVADDNVVFYMIATTAEPGPQP